MSKSMDLEVHHTADVSRDLVFGQRCTIDARAYIGPRCVMGDDVRVGVGGTLLASADATLIVRDGVEVGVGAVVSGARMIGQGARIEAGAVVTLDVPPYAVVSGNPGKVVDYVAPLAGGGQVVQVAAPAAEGAAAHLVGGAKLVRLPEIVDLRGRLSFAEVGGLLPFVVHRAFFVYGVPSEEVRGEHAHKELHEFLIAAVGRISVMVDDGAQRQEVVLEGPSLGLHLPPMVWSAQHRHSPGAVLLVLASAPYSADDYLRSYDDFLDRL